MQNGSLATALTQLALVLLIFYFLLVRPQQKKIKAHTEMVENLKVGDRVMTNGGLFGRVTKLSGLDVTLEIAEKVEVVVDRMSIATLAVIEPKNEVEAKKTTQKTAKTSAAKTTTKKVSKTKK
ncbi:MAG: preprotein translocase subunit YajC [Alphaproteobacteria bacterium]|nr:preprotein translocase subunit YajC [Alphaproteobacteria bacterium]